MAKTKPRSKDEFFQREQAAWDELNALTEGLSEAEWVQPGAAGDWSLKDVWAHLADWMKETRRVLPMLLRDEKVSAHIPQFNAEHYAHNQRLLSDQARRHAERERRALLATCAKLSDEQLLGKARVYNWASYATYNHYAEHIPGLTRFRRAALRRRSS